MDTGHLSDFSRGMASLIGKPTDLRPFVCEGSPLGCEAFLVGINPASEMSIDFWDFWSDSYGFDKRAWFERYKVERINRPLKPGKERRNKVSPTRRVIEWILEEAKPTKCLETNIYAKAAEQALDLDERSRITAPFDYLLQQVEPKLVIAYGKDAIKHLQSQGFECEPSVGFPIKDAMPRLWCVDHFSRGWSKEKARGLGLRIRRACSA